MGAPLEHRFRVRYAECDPQGVVFNAHYLAYFDIGITELWRAGLGSYQAMIDRGLDVVVVEAQLHFHSPARFDDELTLEVAVARIGTTSISTSHRISCGERLVVDGTIHHVLVELDSLSKASIPDWLRDGLAPFGAPA